MAIGTVRTPEKVLMHGVLIAGAIIFSAPFVWLLLASVKVRREESPETMRWLPLAPTPQEQTPYVDARQFPPPVPPDGVPPEVWETVHPRLQSKLTARIAEWQPQTPGPRDNPPPAITDQAAYTREMLDGLFYHLRNLFSDDARNMALSVERKAYLALRPGDAMVRDRDLLARLGSEAVQAGVNAILADTDRLVTDDLLRRVFEACYRRLTLGEVRARAQDFSFVSLSDPPAWSVTDGTADLVARTELSTVSQEVRADFRKGNRSVLMEHAGTLPGDGAGIDRVYVSVRPDDSWARVNYEVIRGGVRYRTRAATHLSDFLPLEQELRWSHDEGNPMARKMYLLLHEEGPADPDDPAFAVRVQVTRNSRVGAWVAKLTSNYRQAFREVNFGRYIATSFALSLLNILLAVFSCTLTAYAFARLQWPGRDICFALLLATMMLPPQVTMIPGFLIYKTIGWYNTLLPMWIPAAFGAPFFVFLLRQFFKNIPKDLEDAARIDGCGFLRIYWYVMLPLVKPTIAVIAIYTFMGVWNNFMGPLIYLNDERLYPLALGLFKLSLGQEGQSIGLMMAGSFIMTFPIILLFFFMQRHFIQGVSLTGMKG